MTNDRALAARYNADESSALLVSACISVDEAQSLIDSGAHIDSLVAVNGAGQDIADYLTAQKSSPEFGVSVRKVTLPLGAEYAVEELHQVLKSMQISSMG